MVLETFPQTFRQGCVPKRPCLVLLFRWGSCLCDSDILTELISSEGSLLLMSTPQSQKPHAKRKCFEYCEFGCIRQFLTGFCGKVWNLSIVFVSHCIAIKFTPTPSLQSKRGRFDHFFMSISICTWRHQLLNNTPALCIMAYYLILAYYSLEHSSPSPEFISSYCILHFSSWEAHLIICMYV